ncbi:polysaccharide biosynthesis protein [Georgenia yuyongxinii]
MITHAARRLLLVSWDASAWIAAVAMVAGARYDFGLNAEQWAAVVAYSVYAIGLQVVVGALVKTYRGRYQLGSFDEVLGLALTTLLVSLAMAVFAVGVLPPASFPRGMSILTPPIALLLMAAGRWAYRAWRAQRRPASTATENALIYGAGETGEQLLRLIQSDPRSPYRVVGLLDDDRDKKHLRLQGVPVLGGRDDLARTAHQHGASAVILAITEPSQEVVAQISALANNTGLRFLVLPPVRDILRGGIRLADLREADIADILGRREIHTEVESIAGYLTGKRVLVTGAGGSIGSELARQVHRYGPAELVLLDRDESALHGVQLSIYGQGLLDTPDMVLADIRDTAALEPIFAQHRPEVVFHAAALKHLPMLEQYPDEGWKTNVLGTLNVLRLAAEHGVGRFVNISTDKACRPTSTLGRTKRIAEQLTAWFAAQTGRSFLSVRFGNVLGSRGSMLHTFQSQIEADGPVTVTHPEITRYFMTIPEASELVIQAAAIGKGAEVLVLDMGRPVRILEVARRLIARSGKNIDIIFTGLRPGEKLHEDLIATDERGECREHPLISHVTVPPMDPRNLGPVRMRQPGTHREVARRLSAAQVAQ